MKLFSKIMLKKAWEYWVEIVIIIYVALFSSFVWPHPLGQFTLIQDLLIALALGIISMFMVKPFKLLIYKFFLDCDTLLSYKKFNTAFEKKIVSLFPKRFSNNAEWMIGKTNLELVLQRATSEIKIETQRATVEQVTQEIDTYKPKTIIATNTSPLSVWFHHAITTYFVAQTKKLATRAHGLECIKRYYLITDKKLLNGIKYASESIFDYWKAASEIHHIADKKLYVIYKDDFNFSFPSIHSSREDDKLLIFLNSRDEIIFVRRFMTENNQLASDIVDSAFFTSIKTFIEGIENMISATSLATTRLDFLKRISKADSSVIWQVH